MKIIRPILCTFIIILGTLSSARMLWGWLDDELQDAIVYQDEYRFAQLLQMNASPDAPDSRLMKLHGFTPLICAVIRTRVDFVRALLHAKADPKLKSFKGYTALDYARLFLRDTQDYPSWHERLVPCYRKKRMQNLKDIINILEKAQGVAESTPYYQQALRNANDIFHKNLSLQLQRINESTRLKEDEKEPGQDGEK
jgi:hypothetical protein